MSKPKQSKTVAVPEIISANPGFGFHSIGSNGEFIQISQTELDWLGYTREEVIGKLRFHDLLTREDKERFEQRFPIFQRTGVAKDVEYDWIGKDGSIVPVSISGTAIRTVSGEFQNSVAVVVNLSQRKRAESAARRQALHTQRQDLISMMDQDIKEPLLAATQLIEMLMRNNAGPVTPPQRAVLAELRRKNESVLQRIELMLDIHKIEEQKKSVRSIKMQLQMPLWKVIEGCVLEVSQSDDFIEQNLSYDLDLNSSSIIVDKYAFETLLSHLLQNAARYSPKGGRISISCTRASHHFELSIGDEGQGIPSELLGHLFERFSQRGDGATPNLGMGLVLCARIVEDYGGNISCVNQPDSGAKFTLRIPMQPDVPEVIDVPESEFGLSGVIDK